MSNTPQNQATPGETSARPKVLRRPQQFSRKAGAAEIDLASAPITTSAPTEAPMPNRSPGRRASDVRQPMAKEPHWQEDSRFGMALIFGVVFVNLVLAFILPLMHKPQVVRLPATTVLGGSAAMPSPTAHRGTSDVTVYRESTDDDRENMDLEHLPEEYNSFETRPEDVPAPTARSMDQ